MSLAENVPAGISTESITVSFVVPVNELEILLL